MTKTTSFDDKCIVIAIKDGAYTNIAECESAKQARSDIILKNEGTVTVYSSENFRVIKQQDTNNAWIIIDNPLFELSTLIPNGRLAATTADLAAPGLNIEYIPDDDDDCPALTRPRIVLAKENNENLQAKIFADCNKDECSYCIDFNT